MATGLIGQAERRDDRRLAPEDAGWHRVAWLRPGHEVELVNLSKRGALVQSASCLKPGTRSELQLSGTARRTVRGRIDRSRVIRLEPLRYEAAVVFEERLARVGSG